MAGTCELIGCVADGNKPLTVTSSGLSDAGTEAIQGGIDLYNLLSTKTQEELVSLVVAAVGEFDNTVAEAINDFNILALERQIADAQGDHEKLEQIDAQMSVLSATGVGAVVKGIVSSISRKVATGTPDGNGRDSSGDGTEGNTKTPEWDNENSRADGDFGALNQTPPNGTLSKVDARKWYHKQENRILETLDPNAPLESQAKQAFDLRNEARLKARDLMSDRDLAESLSKTDPNLSWDEMVSRKSAKGLSGDELYEDIIQSSTTSRQSVDASLGLDR